MKIDMNYNTPESRLLRKVNKQDRMRRKILIVEDSELNREILEELLKEEYDILAAENGEEGIRMLKKHREELSLILLDVYMPVCDGFEFLERTQKDPYMSSIPIIVTTGSDNHEDEEKCLRYGATDFITKPYNLEVLLGRIHNIIRLRESLSTLSVVEFDNLTGLYTMSAFYHHVEQLLAEKNTIFDLSMLDIREFAVVNNIYGEKKGDATLRFVADNLREALPGAMIARQGDHFYILGTPTERMEPRAILSHCIKLGSQGPIPNIRVRIGIYMDIEKGQPVSILCDRVKMALDSIKGDSETSLAYYDERLEQKRVEEQKLLLAFDQAVDREEFEIWLQPKIDCVTGKITAAEALVRWKEPNGNLISPGMFVPLLEREGLIRRLDRYVFRKVCKYQSEQKEQGLPLLPISVNLSRSSLFTSGIVERYRNIIEKEGIDKAFVPIEITESAATAEIQLRAICNEFERAGFHLHMDDFGTGYSSLASLGMLPFEVLKMDKSLIDRIGSEKGNVIVKAITEVAHDLSMQVVAEGVEKQEQVEFLKELECDLIQGYYYSAPRSIESFETLLLHGDISDWDEKKSEATKPEILKFKPTEFKRYLRVAKALFSYVRVLDEQCMEYQEIDSKGRYGNSHDTCYEIWNRRERCSNCISLQAFQTKQTQQKLEFFNNEICVVIAAYVEVDEKPAIVEFMNVIKEDTVKGYRDNKEFFERLLNLNEELYKDIQLGIYNRRFFEEQIHMVDDISAVAVIDVDYFKLVNDGYGHQVGDKMLEAVVNAIKANIRKDDCLIRMGGDEFLLVFNGLKKEFLEEKLETLRKAVVAARVEGLPDLGVTITIGGCCCDKFSRRIVSIADQALYEGKKERNRIVIVEEENTL